MSKVNKKVEKWLASVIQPQYIYKEITYVHVHRFLTRYLPQGFKVRTAVFTSDLGNTQLLINLHGQLHTRSRSVPVSLWVPHNYPYAGDSQRAGDPNGVPLIYVIPSTGVRVRPGNNIDSQGKVYHPYLVQWHSRMHLGIVDDEYLLTRLMDVLASTFEQATPLSSPVITQGPSLPPKLPVSDLHPRHPQPSPLLQRDFTGPISPARPISASLDEIPAKYRAPPPLPGEKSPIYDRPSPIESQLTCLHENHTSSPQATKQSMSSDQEKAPIRSSKKQSPIESRPKLLVGRGDQYGSYGLSFEPNDGVVLDPSTTLESLMDKVSLEENCSSYRGEDFEKLTVQINNLLDPSNPDSIDSVVAGVNEFNARTSSLHSQLEFHYNQARLNQKNLAKHVHYLQEKVNAIKDLNASLEQTEKKNNESPDLIYLTPQRSITVDEIATLDLILLHQLYDVCSEIKACKDTISLVGGTFKSEREIINDADLDACLKAVRSLSRDLFWLEVTRGEIARIMQLDNCFP